MLNKILKTLWVVVKYFIIFAILYSVINWWHQPSMPANPQLNLTDYQGQSIDLVKMSEKEPTLVYFWGSWCGVCSVTSPKVNTLAQQGYPVVSIALKSGSDEEIAQYMQNQGYTFKVVNDNEGSIFANWQGQVTPSYVILEDGDMKQGLTGIQPLWSLKLRLWLSNVL